MSKELHDGQWVKKELLKKYPKIKGVTVEEDLRRCMTVIGVSDGDRAFSDIVLDREVVGRGYDVILERACNCAEKLFGAAVGAA